MIVHDEENNNKKGGYLLVECSFFFLKQNMINQIAETHIKNVNE